MKTTPLHPFGVRVTDLDVGPLDPQTAEELLDLLAARGVAVFEDQHVDDAAFLDFLHSVGETTFTPGETPVAGFPELNVITNVGRTRPPRSQFHTDTSYVRHPPAYTALRAVAVPEQGGQTLFADQYRAFETLPDIVREELADLTVTHAVTGVDPVGAGDDTDDQQTRADHPLCARHPRSGRVALYLPTPQRCAAISGLGREETEDTIAALLDHSTRADTLLAHAWSPGDVVMWDNRCVLHRADHSGVVGDRVMHRGMVLDHS
ncbi:TauD/TfdA dioxygenase family protein [Williamsia sp. SKLECPSW1]